uniref:Uncharacterized protein n=1 Tax=Panagrellus redivivus TaxID=6233 RepID=A0A7E4ZQ20_PANRE
MMNAPPGARLNSTAYGPRHHRGGGAQPAPTPSDVLETIFATLLCSTVLFLGYRFWPPFRQEPGCTDPKLLQLVLTQTLSARNRFPLMAISIHLALIS